MNRNWKLLICAVLIFYMLVGCAPDISEVGEESTPAPPKLTSEEIFSDVAKGKIPVIYSHGGGPGDIGCLVYLTKHPNVDLIGMVLSRGEIHPE